MKVWIDISNSPHVLLFRNLIKDLEKEHEVLVTARKFAYIEGLLEQFGIDAKVIGKHGGKGLEDKLAASLDREQQLLQFVKKEKPDVLVSKSSVEGTRIAYGLGVENIVLTDNEYSYAINRLCIPISTTLLIPGAIERERMAEYGASDIETFKGVCELAHLRGFKPDKNVLKELGVNGKKKLLTIRTGPLEAHYFKNGTSIPGLIDNWDFEIVALPRNGIDSKLLRKHGVIIPEKAVDSLSLMHYSDVVLGEGGSMNREAAVLGTPVISCYPQELLAVDRWLIKKGLMKHSLEKEKIFKFIISSDKKKAREKAKIERQKMEEPISKIKTMLGM